MTLLTTAGGVALILFGVRFLRKGLDRLFGPKLARWMQSVGDSRIKSFFMGLGISVLAPSSITMSILSVQSVQAGHMTARQMLAVILGADVGLTVMVLLIALRLELYAPVLIFLGVLLFQFTKANNSRGVGQLLLSLGFIFTGIGTISAAAQQFTPSTEFIELVRVLSHYPIGIAIMAALLTVAMQSSTAAIALLIGLSSLTAADGQSLFGLDTCIAVVVGANVGIGVSTTIVGWPQVESRRLGFGNLAAKTIIATAILIALPFVADLIADIPTTLDKQIAATHTGFNVLMAIVFFPFIGLIDTFTQRVIPTPPIRESDAFGPRYINPKLVDEAGLATGQSLREILRVSELVRRMLDDLWLAFKDRDIRNARQIQEQDDKVDLLDAEIKRYLAKVSNADNSEATANEIIRQLDYLNELETIGDIIDKNLAEIVIKRCRENISFTPEGWSELKDFYTKVAENVLIAETAFATSDRVLAQRLLRHKERLRDIERELRDQHFARLSTGVQLTHESSAVHLDMLTHLKSINSCVTHVAYAIIKHHEVS
ncbi:Na+/Pi-cotransporter [Poriferisphaera corsica]|uniref:Na+/Pi-cotransporter n=2 Tax=Poriferisphaera corsica TaxID=2528020 RepID=A0A517YSY7_9BACT|nr:Na+/Pi-cotransporter [Poriferisphaera corsica]